MRILPALLSLSVLSFALPAFAGSSATNTYSNESGSVTRRSEGQSSSNFIKTQYNESATLKQEFGAAPGVDMTQGMVRYQANGHVSGSYCAGNQSLSANIDPFMISSCSTQRENVTIHGQQSERYSEEYKGHVSTFSHTLSTDSF